LDKSNLVKSLNESKISRRRPNKNESIINNSRQSCQSELFSDSSMISNNINTKINFKNPCIIKPSEVHDTNEVKVENDSDINININTSNPDIYINSPKKKNLNAHTIKDLSGITQKDNFYIKESIHNSIFNCENLSSEKDFNYDEDDCDRLKNLQLESQNSKFSMSVLKSSINHDETAKQLGEICFQVRNIIK
jgi:hypothetical protein